MNEVLDAFLKAETNVEKDVYIKRLDVHIRVKALHEDTVNELKEQSMHFVGKGKARKEHFDEKEFNGLLIAESCVNIDFSDPKMLSKYSAVNASDCVRKALFAGEIMKLQEEILRISGFGDDEELFEEAKN